MEATAASIPAAPSRFTDEHLLQLLAIPEQLAGRAQEAEFEISPEEKLFQEERKTALGGTDLAAICGLSSYRNAWDVAAERKGILPPFHATERMQWGTILEEPVMQEYARRTGQQLEKVRFVRDPEIPCLGAHPDRLVAGKKKGVEGKTVEFGREKWSDPGKPVRVPQDYYVQCQHYMGVLRYETWDLVALFGLSKMRWYELEQNARVISALREKGEEFWHRYVVGIELPPIEPSDRAIAWLKGHHPEEKNQTIVLANEEQAEAIERWRESKKLREQYEADEEKWKIHVQQAIGDARGIVSGNVTITWTKNRDTVAYVTDYEALLRHYAEKHSFSIDSGDLAAFSRSITTRIGPRVLRVKEAK